MTQWIILAVVVLIIAALCVRAAARLRAMQRRRRANLEQQITMNIPGLGPMTRTEPDEWQGRYQGIDITLPARTEPPDEAAATSILSIIERRGELILASRETLEEALIDTDVAYDLEEIEWSSHEDFTLRLATDSDPDAIIHIRFASGSPVEAWFDH